MQDWLSGKINYHTARNISFAISRLVRDDKDLVKKRFYQPFSPLMASPHVNTIASGKQTLQ